jgi:hypothetical protein
MMMNGSLRTADRSTHAKVGILALLSCVAFVADATSARVTSHAATAEATQSNGIKNHAMRIDRRWFGSEFARPISSFDWMIPALSIELGQNLSRTRQ